MTGSKTVQFVVLLSGKSDIQEGKVVGVSVIPRSAGYLQCGAIIGVLNDWKVINIIIGMVFDTTASNTGKYAGCCTIIEMELCRHHMLRIYLF